MKFSIIVPVYNAEAYLHNLVDSVLAQTFRDYELILVDDGSSDQSYRLMQQYAAHDKRIQAYTKENTGPGMTRKVGFEKSTGDLLFFVDSDDWISTPQTLAEIANLFEANPGIDILFFDREDIIGDTKSIIPGFTETSSGFHRIEELNEIVRPGLGAKILRRDLLTAQMFIESNVFEDLYTTYAYLEKCRNFYYAPQCFYTIYHDATSDSLSSTMTAESFAKSLEMILLIYQRTQKRFLRYSLELRMATLFTFYWKERLKGNKAYATESVRRPMRVIVSLLKKNKTVIKANDHRYVKALLYRALMLISGGI